MTTTIVNTHLIFLDSPEIVEYRELKADIGVCLGMMLITCSIVFESLYHMISQSRPEEEDKFGVKILIEVI
jgi:hypothetical protein